MRIDGGLEKLFELSEEGKIGRVVVEYEDRLARFGYNYLKEPFSIHGVEIKNADEDGGKFYEGELVEDMLALVSSFSARAYGRRGGKRSGKRQRGRLKNADNRSRKNISFKARSRTTRRVNDCPIVLHEILIQ